MVAPLIHRTRKKQTNIEQSLPWIDVWPWPMVIRPHRHGSQLLRMFCCSFACIGLASQTHYEPWTVCRPFGWCGHPTKPGTCQQSPRLGESSLRSAGRSRQPWQRATIAKKQNTRTRTKLKGITPSCIFNHPLVKPAPSKTNEDFFMYKIEWKI